MNDRQLRSIVSGLGGEKNGCPREDGFEITVTSGGHGGALPFDHDRGHEAASFAHDIRLYLWRRARNGGRSQGRGGHGRTFEGRFEAKFGADAGAHLCHGGPFATMPAPLRFSNAHGPEAWRLRRHGGGLRLDLGAEKFFDIKCRAAA